jgi:hypothetical protein
LHKPLDAGGCRVADRHTLSILCGQLNAGGAGDADRKSFSFIDGIDVHTAGDVAGH